MSILAYYAAKIYRDFKMNSLTELLTSNLLCILQIPFIEHLYMWGSARFRRASHNLEQNIAASNASYAFIMLLSLPMSALPRRVQCGPAGHVPHVSQQFNKLLSLLRRYSR